MDKRGGDFEGVLCLYRVERERYGGAKAIMMLTLLLQGSRSESCQLQATLAGGTMLGCHSVC